MADEQPKTDDDLSRRCAALEEALRTAERERDEARAGLAVAAGTAELRLGTQLMGDLVELARRAREEYQKRRASSNDPALEQFAHHAQAFEYVAWQIQSYLRKAGLLPPEEARAEEAPQARGAGRGSSEEAPQARGAGRGSSEEAPQARGASRSDGGAAPAPAAAPPALTQAAPASPPTDEAAPEAPHAPPAGPSRYDMIEID